MRAAFVVLLLLLAGCTADPPPTQPSPFADCSALPHGSSRLPAISLPCFEGGQAVQVGQLAGPMVINFWASWCLECRVELPAFVRLADRGDVTVLLVNTDDPRADAIGFAEDFGLKLPNLFDKDGRFRKELGEPALPVTVFVDGSGEVTKYVGRALTDETLAELVGQRLGLA